VCSICLSLTGCSQGDKGKRRRSYPDSRPSTRYGLMAWLAVVSGRARGTAQVTCDPQLLTPISHKEVHIHSLVQIRQQLDYTLHHDPSSTTQDTTQFTFVDTFLWLSLLVYVKKPWKFTEFRRLLSCWLRGTLKNCEILETTTSQARTTFWVTGFGWSSSLMMVSNQNRTEVSIPKESVFLDQCCRLQL